MQIIWLQYNFKICHLHMTVLLFYKEPLKVQIKVTLTVRFLLVSTQLLKETALKKLQFRRKIINIV